MRFRHTHSSGRFSQSVGAFDLEIDLYCATSDVVTVTEVDKNARARVLQRPGWNAVWGDKGPRDDCGVTTRKEKFEVIFEETHTVSHATYVNERGWKVDTTEAAFQICEDENGELVLFGSLHTPHGMGPELRADRVRSDVAKAYVQISKAYFHRAERLMKKFGVKRAALSGDWNLNFRFPWVRLWFRKQFRGWHLNWGPNFPAHGTHGKFIIDGTFLKGLKVVDGPRVRKKAAGNDHVAYEETLASA